MEKCVAERNLLVSIKGSDSRSELTIKIGTPYIVAQDSVNFLVDEETAACEVDIVGLSDAFNEVTYGSDLLQALQLAADIEPILMRLSRDYDFFFKTGEP